MAEINWNDIVTDITNMAPLNTEQLNDILEVDEGDKTFLRELLQNFSEKIPDLLSQLEIAFNELNREKISFIAHKIKGTASNLGACRLATLCNEIENNSAVIDGTVSAMLMSNVKNTFNYALKSLQEFVK